MAAKIQHCTISSKFDMWVDNGVPNSTLFDFKGTFDLFFKPVVSGLGDVRLHNR